MYYKYLQFLFNFHWTPACTGWTSAKTTGALLCVTKITNFLSKLFGFDHSTYPCKLPELGSALIR